jgi:hypothetical protein
MLNVCACCDICLYDSSHAVSHHSKLITVSKLLEDFDMHLINNGIIKFHLCNKSRMNTYISAQVSHINPQLYKISEEVNKTSKRFCAESATIWNIEYLNKYGFYVFDARQPIDIEHYYFAKNNDKWIYSTKK